MNPMRMVILLAVLWIGGTLLFAAERLAPDMAWLTQATESEIPVAPSRTVETPAADGATPADAEEDSAVAEPVAERESAVVQPAEDEDPEESSSARASSADRGSSPQRFIPSEQVRADFDVSFPIDI